MEQRTVDLIKTLSVQTTTYNTKKMNRFILSELYKIKDIKVKVHKGNIYATKGKADTYPCIVSHTDTVHDIVKNFNIFKLDDTLFSICGDSMQRVGIGGDDKVGVYIALQVIKKVDVCKVAFFKDEEIGCAGSQDADMKFFDDVEFVLQCDRQGYKDFVSDIFGCQLISEDFSTIISETLHKFGRKETSGGLTDVYQLVQNGINVSVANMSCGYYDPHTDNEFVVISEVNDTLDMVLDILSVAAGEVWEVDDKGRYLKGSNLTSNDWSFHDDKSDQEMIDRFSNDIPSADCIKCDERMFYDDYEESHYCWSCDEYIYNEDVAQEDSLPLIELKNKFNIN